MKERKARADENFAVMKIAQFRQHFGWEVIATSEDQNRLSCIKGNGSVVENEPKAAITNTTRKYNLQARSFAEDRSMPKILKWALEERRIRKACCQALRELVSRMEKSTTRCPLVSMTVHFITNGRNKRQYS